MRDNGAGETVTAMDLADPAGLADLFGAVPFRLAMHRGQDVVSGGLALRTVVGSGCAELVSPGGVVSGSVLSGSAVVSAGVLLGATLLSGGIARVSSGGRNVSDRTPSECDASSSRTPGAERAARGGPAVSGNGLAATVATGGLFAAIWARCAAFVSSAARATLAGPSSGWYSSE